MLTTNPEIVKVQRQSNECFTVRLRFTLNRKMKRVSTSLFATPNDLTKDFKIKATSPLKKEVNTLIQSYQSKCAKLQIELNDYTIEDIMDYLNNEKQKLQTIDFIKFSREWIASTTIKGAPNYTSAINVLWYVLLVKKNWIFIWLHLIFWNNSNKKLVYNLCFFRVYYSICFNHSNE